MTAPDPAMLARARILWDFHAVGCSLQKAEVIVGLGSYDLRVADRCAELWFEGYAPRLLFTGAEGNWTRGKYESSEAAAFAERARVQGVPDSFIEFEERATNIGENIAFSRAQMRGAERVIWVTKPQTRRRVAATLATQWPQITSMVTAPRHDFLDQPVADHPYNALVSEMVGDVWRLVAYAEKGFSVSQTVPIVVREAFDGLVAAGFVAHLPLNIRSLDDR